MMNENSKNHEENSTSPILLSSDGKQNGDGNSYVGVVAGGYDEPVPTDIFKVAVNAQSPSRFKDEVCRGTVVRVSTEARKRSGDKWALTTFGVVDDVNVTPGFAFSNAKQMGQSSFYRDDSYRDIYSSTAEDSLELIVRPVGHQDENGELYGPVRPPERESAVYLAQPNEVQKVLMRPITNPRKFMVGAYATLKGLYKPITSLELGKEQIFLHGAIFAASGWGKTVAMKHFIQEFHSMDEPPAILVFNIKGQDFYELDKEMTQTQWEQIKRKNSTIESIWRERRYNRQGLPSNQVTYYSLSHLPRGRTTGNPYSLRFSSLGSDHEGITTFLRLLADTNLPEASRDYLVEYFVFFKNHFTQVHNVHSNNQPSVPVAHGWQGESGDTLANFVEILATARRRAGTQNTINIQCEACRHGQQPPPSVTMNAYSVDAILRALRGIERLSLFDVGQAISIQHLFIPGHVNVIDVATNDSPRAQEIFIRYLLQQIFDYVNRRQYEGSDTQYRGLVIFLDEAWRFFRSETVLEAVETISRMGRSLRIGLWLADQSIPTGAAETTILNNIRTRILGIMAAESPAQIKRIMPLDEKLIASLQNLRRGTGMFFNLEYSRLPVPCVIPACRCFHPEETEG